MNCTNYKISSFILTAMIASCAKQGDFQPSDTASVKSSTPSTETGGETSGAMNGTTPNTNVSDPAAASGIDSSTESCTLVASPMVVTTGGSVQLKLNTSEMVDSVIMSDGSLMNAGNLVTVAADTKTVGTHTVTATVTTGAGSNDNVTCSVKYTVQPNLSCTVVASPNAIYYGDATNLTITPSKAITSWTLDGVGQGKSKLTLSVKPAATHQFNVVVSDGNQTVSCNTTVVVNARFSR